MQFKQLPLLRVFILLLLIVFFTDTVYASGKMAADQMCTNYTFSAENHTHDGHDIHQHEHHKHDAADKQSPNDHCSKCGHCMACFSVLPPSQLDNMQSQPQTIAVCLFEPSYLSHVIAQLNKPPIS
ncbi:MAG: hypothetical protein H7Z18_10285 [Methylophilaceae bacterium]|nr:hypothetical protein [Methylophilaceae bacterium]